MPVVRVEWLACTALLAGCDVLWSIDRVTPIAPDGLVSCGADDHNEDGDAYPDACDLCPGIADDQSDDDGDGVGNACDPSGSEMNQLVLFEPFAAPSAKWNPVIGSWPIENDALVYKLILPDNVYVLYNGVAPEPPYVLDYHYTIDSVDPQQASVFMVVFRATAQGNGDSCGFFRTVGPLKDSVRISFDSSPDGADAAITTVTPGGYRVRLTYDPASAASCKLDADNGSTGGATMAQITTARPPGTFGFTSLYVGVHVDYVAVYKKR